MRRCLDGSGRSYVRLLHLLGDLVSRLLVFPLVSPRSTGSAIVMMSVSDMASNSAAVMSLGPGARKYLP
jgi:hypothetical protein